MSINRIIILLPVFIISFFAYSTKASAEEISLIEFDSTTWSLLTPSQKDMYFKVAVNNNGGLFPETSVDLNINDTLKYEFYCDLLNGGEDTKAKLEILGIADFSTGHFEAVKKAEQSHAGALALQSGKFRIVGSNGCYVVIDFSEPFWYSPYDRYMRHFYFNCYMPDGTLYEKYCFTYYEFCNADLSIVWSTIHYDTETCLLTFDYDYWNRRESFSRNLAYCLGEGGSYVESTEETDEIEDGTIVKPDYSDQTVANSDIIQYLSDLYDIQVDTLDSQKDIASLLIMLSNMLENVNSDSSCDHTEVVASLEAIKLLLEQQQPNNPSSDNVDYSEYLESVLEKLDKNNELLEDLYGVVVDDEEIEETKWKNMISNIENQFGVASIRSNVDIISSAFFGQRAFASAPDGSVVVAISSSNGNSVSSTLPTLKFTLWGKEYNLFEKLGLFNNSDGLTSGGLTLFKGIVSAFLYASFFISLYRSLPSIIYSLSDIVSITKK